MKKAKTKKTRIAGVLWLQGEADTRSPDRIAAYPAALEHLIKNLRKDTGVPDLPFIACTIGELKPESQESRADINAILLNLPERMPHTACFDSTEFAKDIGNRVHFDIATQEKHAEEYLEMEAR